MLNLGKERLIGKIVLKRSFQMISMSVKNLFYDKLARQKISCFISSLVVLFWLTFVIIINFIINIIIIIIVIIIITTIIFIIIIIIIIVLLLLL